MWQRKLCLIAAPGLLFVFLVSMSACSQPPATTETEQSTLKPAEFEVGTITFDPSVAMVDDSVTVSATVKNVGDAAGTYTTTLSVDGQELETKAIIIAPKSMREVSFPLSELNAGTHTVAINDSSTILTVYNWSPYVIQYYDDAYAYGPPIYVSGENGHLTHFTPPAKPFRIQKIHISARAYFLFSTDLDKYNGTVRIWDKDSTNMLWSQDISWRSLNEDGDIEVPGIRVDDDFSVEIVTHSTPTCFVPKTEIPKPCGDPIGRVYSGYGGPGYLWSPSRVVGINSCYYSQLYINAPHSEVRSGYSYMGKPIDPEKDKSLGKSFTDINWAISVAGEGAPGN